MNTIDQLEADGDLTWIRNDQEYDPNADLARNNPFANAAGSYGEANRLSQEDDACGEQRDLLNS